MNEATAVNRERTRLQEYQERESELVRERSFLEPRFRELEQKLSDLRHNDGTDEEIEEVRSEMRRIAERYEAIPNECVALRRSYFEELGEDLRNALGRLEAEHAPVAGEIEALEAERQKLEERIGQLRQSSVGTERRLKTVRAGIANARRYIVRLDSEGVRALPKAPKVSESPDGVHSVRV